MTIPKRAREAAELINRLDRLSRSDSIQTGLNPVQWEALRYLARANRFSRSPAALADYLGSTRGTVSQTLIALEQKGMISRLQSARDRRSLDLSLTKTGAAAMASDPVDGLAADLAKTPAGELDALVASLRATLRQTIRRNGGKAFGACHTCRHFARGSNRSSSAPHHCTLLDEPLSDTDSFAICMEQVDRQEKSG